MDADDRTAFSDAVAALWCVVSLSVQEHIVQDVRHGRAYPDTIKVKADRVLLARAHGQKGGRMGVP